MPLSTHTISELREVAARLGLLLTVPDVRRKRSSITQNECSNCDKNYDDVPWKPEDKDHVLVKLHCGHKFHSRVSPFPESQYAALMASHKKHH